MPGKTSGFFRFFRLQRKTKTESFCRNMCAAKFIVPRTGVRTPVTTSGPNKSPAFVGKGKTNGAVSGFTTGRNG